MYDTLIKPLTKDAYHFVLDTLFPIYCLVCDKEGEFICQDCELKFKKLKSQYCIICQKPSIGGITHPKCQTPHVPEGLISIFNYRDKKLADVLIKGKYKFLSRTFNLLGKMVYDDVNKNFPNLFTNCSLLVPLPLHKHRQRWRGFNQSEILSQSLASYLSLSYDSVLVRYKSTQTQKDLKREQRIKNVKDAFKLKASAHIRGKNIILIDDVTTTGSTLLEAAKVLKRNGASQVWCLTVARD